MKKNIINLLNLIKSANILQKEKIKISFTKANIQILIALYKHGLIQNFFFLKNTILDSKPTIIIYIRYFYNKPICTQLKLLSKPSLYLYFKFIDICKLQNNRHNLFFSTPYGILNNLECKLKKTGGIALFKC